MLFRRSQPKSLPTSPQNYPSGACVRSESGEYYIKGTRRYRIISGRVRASWGFPRVIETTDAALANYKIAGRVGFRDSTLIYSISDGKIYLVSDNKKRHVVSPDVLERLGATVDDCITVSDAELRLHETGEPIA